MTSRRPITIEDLYALRFVGDPQVSPDGRRVAFVVTVIDRDADVYRSHLWLASPDGGEARQHTRGAHRDASPRWSPDGRLLAFVSDRSGEKHVWVIPADGGEAQRVTDGPPVAAAPAWSPDGRWLAYSAKAGARHDPEEPRVVDRVRYKADGEGLWDGRWKQIFIVAAAADACAGVQITTETCDHLDPAWSPDGRLLAYVANPDRGADFTNVSDLWVVPVTEIGAAGAARRLTRSLGPVQSPSWSPDGSRIAYFGHDNACMNATNMGVWIAFADGDAGPADPVNLTAGYDRSFSHHLISDMRAHPSPGVPTWTPDGRRILCLVADGGTTQVCAVEVPAFPPSQPSPPSPPFAADRIPGSPEIRSTNFSGGSEGREASTRTSPRTGVEARSSVRILTEGRRDIYGYSFDRTCGRVALAISDPLVPGDVWAGEVEARGDGAALGGDLLRRLTALNAPLLDQVEMSVPERFEFQGAGGL
ncbi:MAG: PD40 domain-containing protein [Armatimonadetes bacterium]|nr:PD40 domain-containing protein [Armatimonadota bacterium]